MPLRVERRGNMCNAYAKWLSCVVHVQTAAAIAFAVGGTPSPVADADGRPSLLSLSGGLLMSAGKTWVGGLFGLSSSKSAGRIFRRSLPAAALASSSGSCRLVYRRDKQGVRNPYNFAIDPPEHLRIYRVQADGR